MNFMQELNSIAAMPHGPARTAASESVVRRVEAEGARDVLAWALLELVSAYVHDSRSDQAFVVFSKALRLWDESPELFDDRDTYVLFWQYKWIADALADYPQISRAQGEAFLDDMERRFVLQGRGLSAVVVSRFNWVRRVGDRDADDWWRTWITTPQDLFSDCKACTIGSQVDFLVAEQRYDEALELGRTQQFTCSVEPAGTHFNLAYAALMAGLPCDAVIHYRRALATYNGDPGELVINLGRSVEMLGRGGHVEMALHALRNDYVTLLTDAGNPRAQMGFWLGVLAALSTNMDHGGLPTGLAGVGQGTVAELHGWVLSRLRPLVARFDSRNMNSYYSERVEWALAASRSPELLDFSVRIDDGDTAPSTSHVSDVSGPDAGADGDHDARSDGREG
ncbi:MAG: hypothetical protein QM705_12595 [Ancrocorticia sp.]